MIEIIAAALFVLWVIGLVTDLSFGGAIHILLLGSAVLHLVQRSAERRADSLASGAYRRALIPGRQAPLPKGSILLKPRANGRTRLQAASGRVSLADQPSVAPPAAKAG